MRITMKAIIPCNSVLLLFKNSAANSLMSKYFLSVSAEIAKLPRVVRTKTPIKDNMYLNFVTSEYILLPIYNFTTGNLLSQKIVRIIQLFFVLLCVFVP